MKPGLRTTEFWSTLLFHVFAAVIAVAGLFGKNLDGSNLQPLVSAAALLASSIAQGLYSLGRSKVKTQSIISAEPLISAVGTTVTTVPGAVGTTVTPAS